jgi:hypothetical protein
MTVAEFYKSLAWRYMSRWILLSNSDGLTTNCSTCGREIQINKREACAGHWIKVSESFNTALEQTNALPQCERCNVRYNGLPFIMELKIAEKYGAPEVDRLKALKRKPLRLDKYELMIAAEKYKVLFNDCVKIKRSNPWK